MSKMKAIDLVTPERFDLMAKLIYIKYRDKRLDTHWHIELYTQHILVFNGGWEYPGTKTSIDHFIFSFNDVIRSLTTNGFDTKLSVIPFGSNGVIINGSHRVATCVYYNKDVYVTHHQRTGTVYNYVFFRDYKDKIPTGLHHRYLDHMAMEYCKLKTNTRMLVVYPAANFSLTSDTTGNQFISILSQYAKIVYHKEICLNALGLFNIIRELYYGEKWIGDESNSYSGVNGKFKVCLGKGNVFGFLIEPTTGASLMDMKKRLRDIFGLQNHSLHVNDTHQETIRTAGSLFNDNSIHYLEHAKRTYYKDNNKLLDEYAQVSGDSVCVDSSFVMAMYGLRRARDLDYIGKDLQSPNVKISNHNHELQKYCPNLSIDDIVHNPTNHLYIHGVKFATLDIVKQLKEARQEEKDKKDLELISVLL